MAVTAPGSVFRFADVRDDNVKQLSGHAKHPAKKSLRAFTVGGPCFSRVEAGLQSSGEGVNFEMGSSPGRFDSRR